MAFFDSVGNPVPAGVDSVSGCVETNNDLAREIKRNPASFYVNLHNAEFPAGAIRGQLSS